MKLDQISDQGLINLRNHFSWADKLRADRIKKRKDRHKAINFVNPRHEKLKDEIKKELEKRGLQ